MKTIRIIFSVLAAGLGLLSCTDTKDPVSPGTMKIRIEPVIRESRTTLNDERTRLEWLEGDRISVFNDINNDKDVAEYGEDAYIEAEVPVGTSEVYSLYPHSSADITGPSDVTLRISTSQTQQAGGVFEGASYPMAAKGELEGDKVLLSFYPVASALALAVYKTTGLAPGETLKKIRVTPLDNTGFAGAQASTDLTSDGVAFTSGSSSSPITVTLGTPCPLGSVRPADGELASFEATVFVCLARQDYTHLRFEVETSSGLYTVTSADDYVFACADNDFFVQRLNLSVAGFEFGAVLADNEGFTFDESDFRTTSSTLPNPSEGSVPEEETQTVDRIPDFSRVGYRYGDAAFPDYANIVNVAAPTGGDDSALIQAAIDSAPQYSVVQLQAGTYQVDSIICLDRSGIILRGHASGTTLYSLTHDKKPVIQIGKCIKDAKGKRIASITEETVVDDDGVETVIRSIELSSPVPTYYASESIVEDYVPVGRMYVDVRRADGFNVGDRVAVYRPGTSEWIHDIKMDQIPDHNGKQKQWLAKDYGIFWERVVTAIVGNRVYLDNPVVMALDATYGGGMLVKCNWDRISESAVENLKIDCTFNDALTDTHGYCDEAHAWSAVQVKAAEHCWVKGVESHHIGYATVHLHDGARHITVQDCHGKEPVSVITGSRRYAFTIRQAQACLVRDCSCDYDRHQYASGARSPGPNVYYNCTSTHSYSEAGPHHRWATAILYDNVRVDRDLVVEDGEWCGSGHGWRGANFVLWNCSAGRYLAAQSPWVSAKNYAVGCVGEKVHSNRNYQTLPGERPDGEWFPARAIGSTGGENISLPYTGADKPAWWPVFTLDSFTNPESLYLSQLEDRHSRGIYLNNL